MTDKAKKILGRIKEMYLSESEVVMGEFLADVNVSDNLTFEDAFEIYVEAMKWANDDRFIQIAEGKVIEL